MSNCNGKLSYANDIDDESNDVQRRRAPSVHVPAAQGCPSTNGRPNAEVTSAPAIYVDYGRIAYLVVSKFFSWMR